MDVPCRWCLQAVCLCWQERNTWTTASIVSARTMAATGACPEPFRGTPLSAENGALDE
jgi:hypothetical protein